MRVGITLTPQALGGVDPNESAAHLTWAARFADENGFDCVWSTEHHFTPTAFSSSPSVLLSHYASITKKVYLGYAVALLPLHHPMRLAEEMAWVDNISGGRLIGGVSPGWAPYEFDVLQVPLQERHARFLESFEILKKALTGEKFSHQGHYYQLNNVQILPPPLQKGGPRFVEATTSPEGLRRCAMLGVSPLIGYPPLAQVLEQRQVFVDACREFGRSEAEIADLLEWQGTLRRAIVCDTDEEADEEAVQAALGFVSGSAKLRTTTRGEHVEGILRMESQTVPDKDPRTLNAYTGALWGSPATVAKKMLEFDKAGIGHLIIQFHTTTRDLDGIKQNIRRFALEALPIYRKLAAESREAVPA